MNVPSEIVAVARQLGAALRERVVFVGGIEFVRGRTYEYGDVPREIFEGFKGAASAGRYLNRWVKGRYRHRRTS